METTVSSEARFAAYVIATAPPFMLRFLEGTKGPIPKGWASGCTAHGEGPSGYEVALLRLWQMMRRVAVTKRPRLGALAIANAVGHAGGTAIATVW
jgi:hypothetical protein